MSNYQIIDEPKVKPYENLIVDPIVIFMAAILVPLFWLPPMDGRIWLPFLWISINGYLLGSPTLIKELVLSVVGVISWYGFVYISVFSILIFWDGEQAKRLSPYVHISAQAVFFIFLYLVVFTQSTPHAIWNYLREQNK